MTVASEITRLYGVRDDIFTAITNKGVTVPSGSMLDDCPSLIGQISGGAPTPPSLPAKTLRLKFYDGVTPTFAYGTAVQVSSSPNVWDFTYNDTSWSYVLTGQHALLEVMYAGDLSGITDCTYLFQNCSALYHVCYLGFEDSTITSWMFAGCSALSVIDGIDTSSTTNMDYMFYKCYALFTIPLFDTSKVETMQYTFAQCTNLDHIPLLDTGSCLSMGYTFSSCTNLKSIPLLDTSNVTIMEYTFNATTSLTSIPLIDTSSVFKMYYAFQGSGIQSVPLIDTSSVEDARYMFANCASLSSVPLLDTSAMETVSYMFQGCTNVESGALALYNQMISQTTPPSAHSRTFRNCGSGTTDGAAELAQIPSSWK